MSEEKPDSRTQLLWRLIDAGVSGLADIIIDGRVTALDADADTDDAARGHVKLDLKPVPWFHSLYNIFTAGHYISDRRSSAVARLIQAISCGRLPRYHRLHNSFVRWDASRKELCGTDGSGGEFGFTARTAFRVCAVYAVLSLVLLVTAASTSGSGPYGYVTATGRQDAVGRYVDALYAAGWASWALCIALMALFSQGMPLVGSREGALPSLLLHLLQSRAHQTMVSYSWQAVTQGHAQLARALAAVLPDCWVDVRCLVPGQRIPAETLRAARHARVLVHLLSPEFVRSSNCAIELYSTIFHRRMLGEGRCHKTFVLIDNSLFSGTTNNSSSTHTDAALAEAKQQLSQAGYAVVRVGAPVDWATVRAVLEEAGCDIVTSVDDLLIQLDRHAACAVDPSDKEYTINWWHRYGVGVTGGGSADQRHARVPWNIFASSHRVMRNARASVCQKLWYACFRRRPRHACVTTGSGGAWLRDDASEPPQPDFIPTPKCLVGSLIVVGVLFAFGVFISLWASFWPTHKEVPYGLLETFAAVGGGTAVTFVTLGTLALTQWRYCNELAAPSYFLHSKELLPLFVLTEVQDQSEDRRDMPSSSHSSSDRSSESLAAVAATEPMPRAGTVVPSPVRLLVNTQPRCGFHTKLSIVFADSGGSCRDVVRNLQSFLSQHVLGMAPQDIPPIQHVLDVLNSTSHPAPSTIYVLVLDTPQARAAWVAAQERWRPEQVVLVSDTAVFTEGGKDFSTAAAMLQQLLPISTPPTDQDAAAAREVLQAFAVLDRGEPFLLNASTVTSGPRPREALHRVLKRLGFACDVVAAGSLYYHTPSSERACRTFSLVNVLGPMLLHGPADPLSKHSAAQSVVTAQLNESPQCTQQHHQPVRLLDFMLIVYEWVASAPGQPGRARMPPSSPYRGLAPAVLEAVSAKVGPVLLKPRDSHSVGLGRRRIGLA